MKIFTRWASRSLISMILLKSGFRVALAGFDFAFDQFVVRRVDVLIERRGNLLHLEGREEPVVDAFFERIDDIPGRRSSRRCPRCLCAWALR